MTRSPRSGGGPAKQRARRRLSADLSPTDPAPHPTLPEPRPVEPGMPVANRVGLTPSSPPRQSLTAVARAISEADLAEWDAFAAEIEPLRGAGKKRAATARPKALAPSQSARVTEASARHPAPLPPGPIVVDSARAPAAGLDSATAAKLKRGELAIEGRIDLHGMTVAQAHRALMAFLGQQDSAGARCLLVITGKGSREKDEQPLWAERRGSIRAQLADWLKHGAHAPRILAVAMAAAKHGGGGAFYVLLRRKR